ncbi:MAG: LamG domain-containing protein [Holophagales bacterium]|nr:LamG domain-containing protein [Holophagales bacterium]
MSRPIGRNTSSRRTVDRCPLRRRAARLSAVPRLGRTGILLLALLVYAALSAPGPARGSEAEGEAAFHPTQLEGVAFFVESVRGLAIARCSSLDCFDAGENAPLAEQYCDLEAFPDGCVRRWEDQSPFVPARGFEPPEWERGRDFGQDDHDKPGVRLDCVNGKPCVEGGRGAVQERSLEIEPDQPVGPIVGPFSVFLVARPIRQSGDFYYFGFGGSELSHRSHDDSLRLRIGFRKPIALTGAGSVALDQWQLIEVHRDARGRVRGLVDGWDRTLGEPTASGEFHFRFLLSVSRGRAMHGQVAACLVVAGLLTEHDRQLARDYLGQLYGLEVGDGSPDPRDGAGIELARGLLLHWSFDADEGVEPCLQPSEIGPDAELGPNCPPAGPDVTSGRIGQALRFDGRDDRLRARGSSRELDQLFRMTVAAWIRTDRAGDWRSIVDKRDALEDGWDLYLDPEGRGFVRIDDLTLRGDTVLTDGEWHHIAGVYDGAHLLLYVDGRLDRSRVVSRKISLGTSNPLVVGRNFETAETPCAGTLDDIRVYGRALGAPEIRALSEAEE